MKRIGIIGAGMTGLTTALYLDRGGHKITIFEKETEIGGLCRSAEIFPGMRWDKYYHVILSTDEELINLLDNIGLSDAIQFKETKTGFYTDGKLYSMSNTLEFLKFKPLNFINKLRLGLGIFYTSKIKNWNRLEKIYAETWLIKVFGRKNYEKMWKPLLRSKLGRAHDKTSAAFIWATIKRYYGTRHSKQKKEMMGCVKGGYNTILQRLKEKLSGSGIEIMTNSQISEVQKINNGKLKVIIKNGLELEFDKIVATIPNPKIKRILRPINRNLNTHLDATEYLGLICATLILKRSLTPFYVTNLTDPDLPFTGLIEATHVMPDHIMNGKHLVYLPKYFTQEDQFIGKTDNEIINQFINGLKRMFPDFKDEDIVSASLNREPFVQPILGIEYSKTVMPIKTPVKNFFIVNTTMIKDSNLNNNAVIKLSKKAADIISQSKINY